MPFAVSQRGRRCGAFPFGERGRIHEPAGTNKGKAKKKRCQGRMALLCATYFPTTCYQRGSVRFPALVLGGRAIPPSPPSFRALIQAAAVPSPPLLPGARTPEHREPWSTSPAP